MEFLSPKIKWRTQFKIWTCCTTQVFAFCNWLLRCCHFGRTIMQRILLRFLGCRMQFINVTFNIAWYILSSVFKILFSCRTKGDMILFKGLWVVTNDIICISFYIFTLRINKFFSVKFMTFFIPSSTSLYVYCWLVIFFSILRGFFSFLYHWLLYMYIYNNYVLLYLRIYLHFMAAVLHSSCLNLREISD